MRFQVGGVSPLPILAPDCRQLSAPAFDFRTAVGEPRMTLMGRTKADSTPHPPHPHPNRQVLDPRSPASSAFIGRLLKTAGPTAAGAEGECSQDEF